ncbi:MAG: ADP-forming succinate--CoA ligase subunit beta [Armatimonadota bacterium]
MKIHEYQAKQVLSGYGVPVPPGRVASTPAEAASVAEELGTRVVVKAQVHVGGRGKAGGIRLADTPKQAAVAADQILSQPLKGMRVDRVLVEAALDIAAEYYVGVVLDRAARKHAVMMSAMGGVDIEEVARQSPERIAKVWPNPLIGLSDFQIRGLIYDAGLDRSLSAQIASVTKGLFQCYTARDATLAEINPLVVTKDGTVTAADAKMVIDDNALFRQPELAALRESGDDHPLEIEAFRRGLQYVYLGGDIGIIGNGAGLVMATIDEVKAQGGRPANFLDIGGGAKADLVASALELVLMDPQVRGVLLNVFGGITRCDEVAKGVLDAASRVGLRVPMVVRLTGTNEEEGRAILSGSDLVPAETMQEAAQKIVALAGGA